MDKTEKENKRKGASTDGEKELLRTAVKTLAAAAGSSVAPVGAWIVLLVGLAALSLRAFVSI